MVIAKFIRDNNVTLVSSNGSDKFFIYDDISEALLLWYPYTNETVTKTTLKAVKAIKFAPENNIIYVLCET